LISGGLNISIQIIVHRLVSQSLNLIEDIRPRSR